MADTDTIPTNGHTRAGVGDRPPVVGDRRPGGKNSQTTLIDPALLAEVEAEASRLEWPGSRVAFLNQIIRIGLTGSKQRQPRRLEDELSSIFRNGKS